MLQVVEYKQRSLLDEKRQKALDMHLSYIVDQTEKYSDWLTKGLNQPAGSLGSASPSHSLSGLKSGSDGRYWEVSFLMLIFERVMIFKARDVMLNFMCRYCLTDVGQVL